MEFDVSSTKQLLKRVWLECRCQGGKPGRFYRARCKEFKAFLVSLSLYKKVEQRVRCISFYQRSLVLKKERYEEKKKKVFRNARQNELDVFLKQQMRLVFLQHDTPAVTVILVLFNQAPLTLSCLQSMLELNGPDLQVIIFDNASSDQTSSLLDRVEGATIIRNNDNIGFLKAVNLAAQETKGGHLLLLNNDTVLESETITSAVTTLESCEDIGAVGGKLILLDGTLQEAGSIIWQDGSCLGYGRGEDPQDSGFMFVRDVDYCSGAFLLIREGLFFKFGGFDEGYAPAYYEESDFCARLWGNGYRVVYDPQAVVHHFEFASAGKKPQKAIALQTRNRQVFVRNHEKFLKGQFVPAVENILSARSRVKKEKRVLVIDDRVPHSNLGGGFPRALHMIKGMVDCDLSVTLYALRFPDEEWEDVYRTLPANVEVVLGQGMEGFSHFLEQRVGHYKYIFISRPHNMEECNRIYGFRPEFFTGSLVVYDAEALFSFREITKRTIKKQKITTEERQELIDEELDLCRHADRIISVSNYEAGHFFDNGYKDVKVLGHCLAPTPTPSNFGTRKDFLFVGALIDDDTPNTDSLVWFVNEIFPLIQKELGHDVRLLVVGGNSAKSVQALASSSVHLLGVIDSLTEVYDQCRVFIAPTRYAAGLPHKVHEAAAFGIPVVVTPLLAGQLGWSHGTDIMAADTPADFARNCVDLYSDKILWNKIRANALDKVIEDCSVEKFSQMVKEIFSS